MKVCRARSARRHSCQGRTQQRALRLSQATGLKWVILNSGKPQDGVELGNRPLAAALLFKSTFLKLPATRNDDGTILQGREVRRRAEVRATTTIASQDPTRGAVTRPDARRCRTRGALLVG